MPLLNRTVVLFGTHVFSKDYVTMVMSMHNWEFKNMKL